jgi:hypothetical protein
MIPLKEKEEYLKMARKLAKMDENSLYEILGVQALGLKNPFEIKKEKGANAYSINMASSRREGRGFFEDNIEKLRTAICGKAPQGWDYCKKAEEYEKDFDKLMTALVPIVGSVLGLGAAVIGLVVVVCVILFKYGLRKFCKCK